MLKLSLARPCSSRTPFESYLCDINETPLLDAEEEKALAYRIIDGDPEARDHLVRANLRLVVRLAQGYVGKGLDLADLIAEGNLGLLRAVEGFDPSMNTRFSTYACFWIKQSIKRAVINTGKPIRIPAYMSELLVKWRRATSQLHEELGRPPTQEEVAGRLKLSPKKFRIIKKALNICNALPQTGQDDGDSPIASAWSEEGNTPDSALTRSEDLAQVLSLVDELSEREAIVVRLRFGLNGETPCTLMEIGKRLDLTRERVRQIERDALARLAASLESA